MFTTEPRLDECDAFDKVDRCGCRPQLGRRERFCFKEFPQQRKPAEELSVLIPKGSKHEGPPVTTLCAPGKLKIDGSKPTRSCGESPCCTSGGTSRRCSCHRYWHSRPARTEQWNSLPFARKSSWDLSEQPQNVRWFSAEMSSPQRRGIRSNRPRTLPARPGHWLNCSTASTQLSTFQTAI